MEENEMALVKENQLKKFPKFLETLMGKDETYKMVLRLDRFAKEGNTQLVKFLTWDKQDEKSQFEFVVWLIKQSTIFYASPKYSDAHKIGIVNATNRKKLKNVLKKLYNNSDTNLSK